ncbi:hypothetical protein C0989_008651 [Termitomyces sp. Mn162]|nr:hypothetical protein C0989_008651 [Termitomyces sp. Mn162]
MSYLSQRLAPENQAQRAQDQALNYINNFPPVIINGEDITRDARNAVRRRIEATHLLTLESLQPRRGQFLGGLFAFFLEIANAKQLYKAEIKEFKVMSTAFVSMAYVVTPMQSATERIKYEALQTIEREVAKKISQEGATELLAPHAGRLSNDVKRVANQIYKKSAEISGESRHSHQGADSFDDEDDLENIDVGAIYNNVSAVLDMYYQDGKFEKLWSCATVLICYDF